MSLLGINKGIEKRTIGSEWEMNVEGTMILAIIFLILIPVIIYLVIHFIRAITLKW
jgi:hypothetical protein